MIQKKIVAFYRKGQWSSLQIKWYAFLGYEIHEWADPEATHTIPFPASSRWTPIMLDARQRLAKYFKDYITHYPDSYIYDYVRKIFDLTISDYCAFRYSIETNLAPVGKVKVIGPQYLAYIYDHKCPLFDPLFLIGQLMGLVKFAKRVAMALCYCGFFRGDISSPQVLFFRKKAYPDLSISETLGNVVRARGVSYEGTFLLFSSIRSKYGFYYLNAFKNSFQCVLLAVAKTLRHLPADAFFFLRYGLPLRFFSSLLTDSLTVATTTQLGASVMTGVLVDKPIFVLLSRYKTSDQKIAGINEFFCFFPFRGFDYNHLDVYYSMNEIDARTQNNHGGSIGRIVYIPFFRNHNTATSDGLSPDLKVRLAKFNRCAVATTTQIATYVYSLWSKHEVEDFIKALVNLAQIKLDTLFIVKGKKGELRSVPEELMRQAEALENMYVIHSDVPRELKYNQFEDIIKEADVLIAMTYLSTTIWQAIAADIPAIAINDVHPASFLREFSNFEVPLNDLPKAFEYWNSISKEEWFRFKDLISRKINLTGGNAFEIITDDIAAMVN